MKTYRGYKVVNANDPENAEGVVWWDGKKLHASSDSFLKYIKSIHIPFSTDVKRGTTTQYSSEGAEDFFDLLPMAFRNGYVHLKRVTVDEDGNII
jgi:hypothetical protein